MPLYLGHTIKEAPNKFLWLNMVYIILYNIFNSCLIQMRYYFENIYKSLLITPLFLYCFKYNWIDYRSIKPSRKLSNLVFRVP